MRNVSETLDFSSVAILVQALLNCPKTSIFQYQKGGTRRQAEELFVKDELPKINLLSWLRWIDGILVLGRRSYLWDLSEGILSQNKTLSSAFKELCLKRFRLRKKKCLMFSCQLDPEVCLK